MGDDYDRRKLAVTEEYQIGNNQIGGEGRNYKSIHSDLKKKETMSINSEVMITSGTHKGMKGKIIALSDTKAEIKRQQRVMGE